MSLYIYANRQIRPKTDLIICLPYTWCLQRLDVPTLVQKAQKNDDFRQMCNSLEMLPIPLVKAP